MQLERFLNLVEDAPHTRTADVTRDLLWFAVTQEKDVELGSQPFQPLCKGQSKLPAVPGDIAGCEVCRQKFAQDWAVVGRRKRNAFIDDHSFEAAVEDRPQNGIFEIPDKNWFVDELVLGPA